MAINENQIVVLADQRPGMVTFRNYEELKRTLIDGLEGYRHATYLPEQVEDAKADVKALKSIKKQISDKKKELKAAYSAPYEEVEAKLDELIAIIDEPLKLIDEFVKGQELGAKQREIAAYARKKAAPLGEYADRILESPAFKNPKWDNATFKTKQWQDEIDAKITQAKEDIHTLQAAGGKHTAALMARYFETLTLEGSKEFIEALESETTDADIVQEDEEQVVGYKVLKITATESQMAGLLSQFELMALEVEELEDGMPKEMQEITEPTFDSFVAFDIETTGTWGAGRDADKSKITEIGAVKVVNGVVVDTFDELANPGRKIVPMVARITHITDEMVADKPPVDDVIRRFVAFCDGSALVGHNIKGSDLHYIREAARHAGVAMENSFLDTYLYTKRLKKDKGWANLKLGYLAEQFGIEHEDAHRAWSDAKVNAQLYLELKKLFDLGG